MVKKILMREVPVLADIYMPTCDVRDVARAHIYAMMKQDANSQRHIIVSNTVSSSMKELALILDKEFSTKGYNVPTKIAPNFLIKIMSIFDDQVKLV